jgi:integrase
MDAFEPASAIDDDVTVAAYLEDWLQIQTTQVQPSTWVNYKQTIRNYVLPHIGDLPLSALTVRGLTSLYAMLLDRGGRDGASLKPSTAIQTHNILHKSFEDAVAMKVLAENPATGARVPKVDRNDGDPDCERQIWDAAQLRAFLAHTAGDRFGDLWLVLAFTGLRRGEALGLRWTDVDLDVAAPLLRVRRSLSVVGGQARLKEPKTARSRPLHLDDPTVATLRRRLDLQAAQMREHGPVHDNRWGLVFTDHYGRHLSPELVSQEFRRTVVKAPVPTIRLHDLRHVHATLLLQAGVPVKVVSERLGHHNVFVTMTTYAHVLPAMDAEAVHKFSAYVFADAADEQDGPLR